MFQQLPVFAWAPVRGADHYEFQMAADPSFRSLLGQVGEFTTRSTRAALTTSVANGTYWWRVRAIFDSGAVSAYSRARSVRKNWTTAPRLLEPRAGTAVHFPTPLTMSWKPVDWATKYLVYFATDTDLSTLVNDRPIETSGTTFTLDLTPGSAAKTYYWAVRPVDAQGNKGALSEVRPLSWEWPSNTTVRWTDLRKEEETIDPQFSWDPVPGAAAYEIEINSSRPPDWAPSSRVCCKKLVVGTTFSPTQIFADNTYYWRVRAIDVKGNAGVWNCPGSGSSSAARCDDVAQPQLPKVFDKQAQLGRPSISNLHMEGDPSRVPVVAWDPVPGASAYLVEVAAHARGVCDWGGKFASEITPNVYWTPLARASGSDPYPASVRSRRGGKLLAPASYCVRVRAESDKDTTGRVVYGDFTYLNGSDNPAFTYAGPPCPSSCGGARHLDAGSFRSPGEGVVTSRAPLLTWAPSAGATWWVLVAKDPDFHTVVEYAFVNIPAYAPRTSFTDEATHYYWTVLPSPNVDGRFASGDPLGGPAQSFDKRSVPPTLVAPAVNASVTLAPRFEWTPIEGARQYHFQVSQDRDFGKLLDDVKTDSIAYTSNTNYPPDVALYWRVRAETSDGVALGWSTESRRFTYHLKAPTPNGAPAKDDLIPTFRWSMVTGAISYDFHIDYPSGRSKDFNDLPTAAFTATKFTGPGVWHWRVRANFPGRVHGPWSCAGSAKHAARKRSCDPTTFTKTIAVPEGLRSSVGSTYIVLSWRVTRGATSYAVQMSPTPDFHSAYSTRTDGTSFVPTMQRSFRTTSTVIYWRVGAKDESRNQGAFTKPRTFVLPSAFRHTRRH